MAIDLENLPAIGSRSASDILELLGKSFRPEVIKSRKIAGRDVRYLPITAVVERLNKSTNSWDFRVVSRDRKTMVLNRWNDATRKSEPRDVMVSVVIGELTIPEIGTRQGLGVQSLDDGSGEDLLKGAVSDSLKKAAQLFGLSPPLD